VKCFCLVIIVLGLFKSLPVVALGKLDASLGAYSLSAKSSQGEGKASGLGSYIVTYHYGLVDGLDFSVGYSLFFSNIITGDMGFGPDLGITYYPISSSGLTVIKTEGIYLLIKEQWRPLINFSFNQRQFQSSDSSYAGLSFGFGTEYSYSQSLDFKGMFRYQALKGPASTDATFIDFLFGLSISI
jgi:hypothetical protein